LYKCDKALIESDAYGVKDKDLCLGFCDRSSALLKRPPKLNTCDVRREHACPVGR